MSGGLNSSSQFLQVSAYGWPCICNTPHVFVLRITCPCRRHLWIKHSHSRQLVKHSSCTNRGQHAVENSVRARAVWERW
eukprot:3404876-Amphidinium_carterae.2